MNLAMDTLPSEGGWVASVAQDDLHGIGQVTYPGGSG
jgi:hypothetical protein